MIDCYRCFKENKDNIINLLDFYQKEGYNYDNGLIESTVYIKRPKDKTVKETMDLWYKMIKSYSKRDQLSFNYCIYKTGLMVRWINKYVFDNEWFSWDFHQSSKIKDYSVFYGDIAKEYVFENEDHFSYEDNKNTYHINFKTRQDSNPFMINLNCDSCKIINVLDYKGFNEYELVNAKELHSSFVSVTKAPYIKINEDIKEGTEISVTLEFTEINEAEKNNLVDILANELLVSKSDIDQLNLRIKVLEKYLPINSYKNLKKIKRKIFNKDPYEKWMDKTERIIKKSTVLTYNPKISVVVPVYNAIPNELVEMIESVRNQTYTNWELCLVDDASTKEETLNALHKYDNADPRIKIKYNTVNGHISKTSNDGIEMATGEFVALLDNDDLLSVDALYEVAKKLNENNKLDYIYSDEDKISSDGKVRENPFFKPDWSPDTFMSLMYTCHLSVFRKSILEEIGGFTVGLEGSQDYDLVMRFTEKTNNVGHIPKILYHWRLSVNSTAVNVDAKPYSLKAMLHLKENALKRRNHKGRVVFLTNINQFRVIYEAPKNNLTLIIKSNDITNTKNLIDKVTSLDESYIKNIIVLSKNKINIDTKYNCHVVKDDYSLYKDLIDTDYVYYIEDDVLIDSVTSISTLLGSASLNYAGAVGPKIYYKNTNIIYSDGVSKNNNNIFNGMTDIGLFYFGRNKLDYNTYSLCNKVYVTNKENYDYIKNHNNAISSLNDINKYNLIRNDVIVHIDKEYNAKSKRITTNTDDPYINKNLNGYFDIK